MAVPMDNASELSSREHVQRLYNKNVEYENKRRRSAQSRIPLDPNAWRQMRENFETIILEDYAFAEQHEIEFALWQLHYGRIEELRAHFNGAMASSNSSLNGQAEKSGLVRSDRIPKIRAQFKTFLVEATGFYHELMLKIRAKYGLPLGYFSDDPEDEVAASSKEGNGSPEFKKGLVSCHRCLIYLGDLARYKGIYGEGEMKSRDFSAASSYYLQASSCWPSSGNPHHQLAILASYSGDEFVAFYRYFRSLAVDNPFSVARDNLIIAFEKNRQKFSQMIANAKISAAKLVVARNGKGRARSETRFSTKDQKKVEANTAKERQSSTVDTLKAFSVKFVRLNGILFTRTSMETFEDVLLMAKNDFLELLLSCSEEVCSFGSDDAENGLFIIRLVAIIIFTVHNANRESEDQSYAEILQRTVILQNAYTAAFEFMGHIMDRCIKFHDSLSSFLLPGVLVFVEWLACHPEIVTDSEEEKLANARTYFWNSSVALFNKLMSTGSMHEDDTCFLHMSKYEEGESANRLALGEDFELRGFLPLQPGRQIIDFSRKHSFWNEGGNTEKKARVQRIVAAAKAFSSVVRVGQKVVYFDHKLKKFAIGEPHVSYDLAPSSVETHEPTLVGEYKPAEMKFNAVLLEPASVMFFDGDDEEEIVFKPYMAEKHPDEIIPISTSTDVLRTVANAPLSDAGNYVGFVSSIHDTVHGHDAFVTSAAAPSLLSNGVAQQALPNLPNSSNWLLEHTASVMNGLRNFSLMEDGHSMNMKLQDQYGGLKPPSSSHPFVQPIKLGTGSLQPVPEALVLNSVSSFSGASMNTLSVLPYGAKKNPVSRPLRHIGPPPGFTPSEVTVKDDNPLMDDYSWLDGYQTPFSSLSSGLNGLTNLSRDAFSSVNKGSSMNGIVAFPFPGKQASSFQIPMENSKVWPDYQFPQPLNLYQEHQHKHQFLHKGNQQPVPLQSQFQGQSLWEGNFLV